MDFTDSHVKIDITTGSNHSKLNGNIHQKTFEVNARVTHEIPTLKSTDDSPESQATAPAPSQENNQKSQNAPRTRGQDYNALSAVLNYIRMVVSRYIMVSVTEQQQIISRLEEAINAIRSQDASASPPSTSRQTAPSVPTCPRQTQPMATSISELAPGVSNVQISQESRLLPSDKHSESNQNPPCPSTSTCSSTARQQQRPNQERVLNPESNNSGSGTSTSRDEQSPMPPEAPRERTENYQIQPVYSNGVTIVPSQLELPYPSGQGIAYGRAAALVVVRAQRIVGPRSGPAQTLTTSANSGQESSTPRGTLQTETCPRLSTMHTQNNDYQVRGNRLPGSSQNTQQGEVKIEDDDWEEEFHEGSHRNDMSSHTSTSQSSRYEALGEQQEMFNRPKDLRTVIRDEHLSNTSLESSSQLTFGRRPPPSETIQSTTIGHYGSQDPPPAPHSSAPSHLTWHQGESQSQNPQYVQNNEMEPNLSAVNSQVPVMRDIPVNYQHYSGYNTHVSENNPHHPTERIQQPGHCPSHTPYSHPRLYERALRMESRQLPAYPQPSCGHTVPHRVPASALQYVRALTYQNIVMAANLSQLTRPSASEQRRDDYVTGTECAVESSVDASEQNLIETTTQTATSSDRSNQGQSTNRMAAATQTNIQTTNAHTNRAQRCSENLEPSVHFTYWRPAHVHITEPARRSNAPSIRGHPSQTLSGTSTETHANTVLHPVPTDQTRITANTPSSNVLSAQVHPRQTPIRTGNGHQSTAAFVQVPTQHTVSIAASPHSNEQSTVGHLSQTTSRTITAPQSTTTLDDVRTDQPARINAKNSADQAGSIIAHAPHSNVQSHHVHPSQTPIRTGTDLQSTVPFVQVPTQHTVSITASAHSNVLSSPGHLSEITGRTITAPQSTTTLSDVRTDQPARINAKTSHSNVQSSHGHSNLTPSRKVTATQSTMALLRVPADQTGSIITHAPHSNVRSPHVHPIQNAIRAGSGHESTEPFVLVPTQHTVSIAPPAHSNVQSTHGHLSQTTGRTAPQSTTVLDDVRTDQSARINAKTSHSNVQSPHGHSNPTPPRMVTATQSTMALLRVPADQIGNIIAHAPLSNVQSAHGHQNQTTSRTRTAYQLSESIGCVPTVHIAGTTSSTHSNVRLTHGHSQQMPRRTLSAPQLTLAHTPTDQTRNITPNSPNAPSTHLHQSQTPSRTETGRRSIVGLVDVPIDHSANIISSARCNVQFTQGILHQTPTRTVSTPYPAMPLIDIPTDQAARIAAKASRSSLGHSRQTPSGAVTPPQSPMALVHKTTGQTERISASAPDSNVQLAHIHASQTPRITPTAQQSTVALADMPSDHTANMPESAHSSMQLTLRSSRRTPSRTTTSSPLTMALAHVPTDQPEGFATNTLRSNFQSSHGLLRKKSCKTATVPESVRKLVHVPMETTTNITTSDLQSTRPSGSGQTEQVSNRIPITSQSTSSEVYPSLEIRRTPAAVEFITTGFAPERTERNDALDYHQMLEKQMPQCVMSVESNRGPTSGSEDGLFSTEQVARILCEVQAVSAARARSRDRSDLSTGLCEQQTYSRSDYRHLEMLDDHEVEEGELIIADIKTEEDSQQSSSPDDEWEEQYSPSAKDQFEQQADVCESDQNPQQIDAHETDEDELQYGAQRREYELRLSHALMKGEREQQRDVIEKDQEVEETCVAGGDDSDVEQCSDGPGSALRRASTGARRRASSPLPDSPPSQRPRLDDSPTGSAAVAAAHSSGLDAEGPSTLLQLKAVPSKSLPDKLAMWQTLICQTHEQAQSEVEPLSLGALVQALEQASPVAPLDLHPSAGPSRTEAPDSSPGSSQAAQVPDDVCAPGTSSDSVHVADPDTSYSLTAGHGCASGLSNAKASGSLIPLGSTQVYAPGHVTTSSNLHPHDYSGTEAVAETSATDDSVSSTVVSPALPLSIVITAPVSPLTASAAVADQSPPPGSATPKVVSCPPPSRGTRSSFEPPGTSNCPPNNEFSGIKIKQKLMDAEPDSPSGNGNSSEITDYATSASPLLESSNYTFSNITMNEIPDNLYDTFSAGSSKNPRSEIFNLHSSDQTTSAQTTSPPNDNLIADCSDPPSIETLASITKPSSSLCLRNTSQMKEDTNSPMASSSTMDCTLSSAISDKKIKQEPNYDDEGVPGPSTGKKSKSSGSSTRKKVRFEDEEEDCETDDNEDFKKKVHEQKKKKKNKFKRRSKAKSRIQWMKNLRQYKEDKK